MTEEPAPDPAPAAAPPDASRERARIEPSPTHRSADLLPGLYLLGFVVLAGAMYFLWANPPETRLAPQEASRIETLQSQIASLRDEVATLRNRPVAQPGPSTADFARLQQQVAELSARPVAQPLQSVENRIAALEGRPTGTPEQMAQLSSQVISLARSIPDVAPLTRQLDAVTQRTNDDAARLQALSAKLDEQARVVAGLQGDVNGRLTQQGTELSGKLAATQADLSKQLANVQQGLSARIDTLVTAGQGADARIKALTDKVQLAVRLQGVATALSAGHKLGDLPGAPPALARYAQTDPPTEAALRGSFDDYAARAQAASQPAAGGGNSFGDRMWARAQQSLTVRQGDRVLVGDQSAGVLAHAREQLDNGDLAGAVKSLDGLQGPAAAAMQPWVEQARNLLDARAALATLAAG